MWALFAKSWLGADYVAAYYKDRHNTAKNQQGPTPMHAGRWNTYFSNITATQKSERVPPIHPIPFLSERGIQERKKVRKFQRSTPFGDSE